MKRLLAFVLLTSALCLAQGGTTSSDILPANTGQNLGSSDYRWNLYAQTIDVSGAQTFANVNGVLALDGTKYAYTSAGLTSMLSDAGTGGTNVTRSAFMPTGNITSATRFTSPANVLFSGAGTQNTSIWATTGVVGPLLSLGGVGKTITGTRIEHLGASCNSVATCTAAFYTKNANENSGFVDINAGTYGAAHGVWFDGHDGANFFVANALLMNANICCGGDGAGSGLYFQDAYNTRAYNVTINSSVAPYYPVGVEIHTDNDAYPSQPEIIGLHVEGITNGGAGTGDDIYIHSVDSTANTLASLINVNNSGSPLNVLHTDSNKSRIAAWSLRSTGATNMVKNDYTATTITSANSAGYVPIYLAHMGGSGDGWDEMWMDNFGLNLKGHGLKISSSDAMEAVLTLRGGTTTDTTTGIRYNDHTNTTKFLEYRDTSGTLRIDVPSVSGWVASQIFPAGNYNLNSTGSNAIKFNMGGSGATANGTGGVIFGSGGASPSQVASVDATGMVTASNGFAIANRLSSGTAPTVSSGFGTSPTITNANGTAVFVLTIGTGGTASTGILTMPTAAHGWACDATDVTNTTVNVYITKQTGYTTTSVTLTQFNNSAVATPWAASDQLLVKCSGF